MANLVFINNEKVVTDSLTVAATFNKEHSRVMRDIRNLKCSEEFRVGNFAESTYINKQDRKYPKYIISEQGFSILVMSYTGKNAMKFKEMYINEFERMKKHIKNNVRILNDRESAIESMKLTIQTAERQKAMDTRLSNLEDKVENQITLEYGEQRRLQRAIGSRVYRLCDNKDERPKMFSEIHREIKDRFGVSSYKDVLKKDLQTAIQYVDHWVPKKVLS